MALSPTGPLERAAAAAREEQPEDWESVSRSVKRRIRETITPSRPVVVVAGDGSTDQDEHGSRTYIASRVVRARLRDALRRSPEVTAERIDHSHRTDTPSSAAASAMVTAAWASAIRTLNSTLPIRYCERLSG